MKYRYWETYDSTVHMFYPILIAKDEFCVSLFTFIEQRLANNRAKNLPETSVTSASWLALLFAVMACGVQFSNDPVRERDLRAKVFGMLHPSTSVLLETNN